MTNNLTTLITDLRSLLGRSATDPIDSSRPPEIIERRIAAHNALLDLARPGRDRYCGRTDRTATGGPCILRDRHHGAVFDARFFCMDVEQRDRAERYLAHSEPDPARRA